MSEDNGWPVPVAPTAANLHPVDLHALLIDTHRGSEHILAPVIVCLGEAIVDLVHEGEAGSIAAADSFSPELGGALANVAIAARRAGARARLAGGAGDDDWGRWLCERLEAEGVELDFFSLVPGARTPIAFITFDVDREPDFLVYGEGIEAGLRSLDGRLEGALDDASALVFGSNTLVNEPERELTVRAVSAARERGLPVLFDPNLREHRWRDLDLARRLCRELSDGAAIVRTNLKEGLWLSGLDPAAGAVAAADAIAALGAELAVVTRGPDGAVMRGAADAQAGGVEVDLVTPLGAGDAFMGTLAAELDRTGFEPARAADALAPACAAAAEACKVWRAVP